MEVNRREDGTFLPGSIPNPNGRPKGKTMKEFARDYYMLMNDTDKIEYIKNLEKVKPGFAWQMGEGNPSNETDLTSKGEKMVFLPAEVIKNLNDTPSETEGSN